MILKGSSQIYIIVNIRKLNILLIIIYFGKKGQGGGGIEIKTSTTIYGKKGAVIILNLKDDIYLTIV